MRIVKIFKGQISHFIKARLTECREMSIKYCCSFSFSDSL